MRTFWMVLGGAAAGAGLAYLFSPAGARAREVIRERTSDCVEATRGCVETTSHFVAEKAQQGQRAAREVLEQGQELAGHAKETFEKVGGLVEPVKELAYQSREVLDKAKNAAAGV